MGTRRLDIADQISTRFCGVHGAIILKKPNFQPLGYIQIIDTFCNAMVEGCAADF
jgi:hypothetical protein